MGKFLPNINHIIAHLLSAGAKPTPSSCAHTESSCRHQHINPDPKVIFKDEEFNPRVINISEDYVYKGIVT